MKIDDFKNLNLRHMSDKEIKKYRDYIVKQYTKTNKNFNKTKKFYYPDNLKKTNRRLVYDSRVKDDRKRMIREINTIRGYYFTRIPGNRELTRTKTSTIEGYKAVLRKRGKKLGIKGYDKWTEKQRKDLWKIMSKVKELAPDYFRAKGFGGSYLYESGTSYKTLEIIIEEVGEKDPVKVLEKLKERVQAIQDGNKMTDREFFGVDKEEEEIYV